MCRIERGETESTEGVRRKPRGGGAGVASGCDAGARRARVARVTSPTVASGGNDHYYLSVVGPFTVFQAQADLTANYATYLGMSGYLVTITSAEEQEFVSLLSSRSEWWTSGSDGASAGSWIWTAGPEAGQAFTYTNWPGAVPTDPGLFLDIGACGGPCWTVSFGDRRPGYVVEYSAAPVTGAPEPSTVSALMLGLAAVAWHGRRRRSET